MENQIELYEPHPLSELLTKTLASRASTEELSFFRVIVAYYLANMASTLGTTVEGELQNKVPSNVYALALAPSGFGKGTSIGVMEREVFHLFREDFMNLILPDLEEKAPIRLAEEAFKYVRNGSTMADLEARFKEQSNVAGNYVYSFDEATVPAIKQLRTKIQLLGVGSLNLEVDELGSNIQKSAEALKTYLELYDTGQIKTKLTKNTKENVRGTVFTSPSPANLLMFGTPSSLLNSGKEEETFMQFLEAGYARRCLFAYQQEAVQSSEDVSIDSLYNTLKERRSDDKLQEVAEYLRSFADPIYLNRSIYIPPAVGKVILKYKLYCQDRASSFKTFQTIHTHEVQHRHFKATKLASVYTFLDKRCEMTVKDFERAVFLVEESGKALHKILKRDKPAVIICKFIEEMGTSVTVSDLTDHLPFYKTAGSQVRSDLVKEAKAWGFTNNIVIQEYLVNGITFYKGERLNENSLSQIRLSVSQDMTYKFTNIVRDFSQLGKVFKSDWNWCSHHLKHGEDSKGHRADANCVVGCNLLVLDIDDTKISPETASSLLKDYHHILYTTKSNEKEIGVYCYRVVIPTNYLVRLDEDDFKKFMESASTAFPFNEIDVKTFNRTRLWFGNHNATVIENFGDDLKMFDVIPHIPKTVQNVEYAARNKKLGDVTAIERYFLNMMEEGNRNHSLLRYGLMLMDSGMDYVKAEKAVLKLNEKQNSPLNKQELADTIFKTLAKRAISPTNNSF